MKLEISLFLLIVIISFKSIGKQEQPFYTSINTIKPSKVVQDESYERGREVYSDFCLTCHLPNGKGVPGITPPLDGSNWLTEKRKESIHAIKFGLQGPIQVNGETYNGLMAPQGLSNQEVADVMNYILNSWSNSSDKPVTNEEVIAIAK